MSETNYTFKALTGEAMKTATGRNAYASKTGISPARKLTFPAAAFRSNLDRNVRLFSLSAIQDKGGMLVPMESGEDVPFNISRVFFIRNFQPETVRGRHAHQHLQELLICVQGECEVKVTDGSSHREFHLGNPAEALYVGPMMWLEIHNPSPDCIILALASTLYDPEDCINDYDTFLELAARWNA